MIGDGNHAENIHIDFRQKLVKCFYSEQKAIKTDMSLTFKEINNTDNAVLNLVRAVTDEVILRNSVTESHEVKVDYTVIC